MYKNMIFFTFHNDAESLLKCVLQGVAYMVAKNKQLKVRASASPEPHKHTHLHLPQDLVFVIVS